jgi:hypothetical protein
MNYTKKRAIKAFKLLCLIMGKRIAKKYDDVGAWQLDYNYYYGGLTIHEIFNKGGGVVTPIGAQRYSTKEFIRMVDAIHEMHVRKIFIATTYK